MSTHTLANTLTPDGTTDNSTALAALAAARASAPRATLYLPDGVYGISRPLVLPVGVSLRMDPGAALLALPGFDGEAVVETRSYERPSGRWEPQSIEGGMIDGGEQAVIGIRTARDRETDIRYITIRNCLRKGIHIGTESGCEMNLTGARVQCERGVIAEPDSIGVHYDKAGDSLVCGVVIIGYATGFRIDSSSNDIQQVHVWNYDHNCSLTTCFHCGGWNDSYNQCYADSPMNGDEVGYGFYVDKPFQRISNCRVYNNQWATPDKVIGIHITDSGTHGTYIGNHFTAREGHRMLKAFGGNLDSATILGNSFNPQIAGGRVSQIPSGGGGASPMPEVTFPGT